MQDKRLASCDRIASLRIGAQYVVLFHHFRRFLQAAADRGIDVAPLKGAHLLTSVYPPDEDRGYLADIDFLVRPGDWDRTGELLREQGFVRLPVPGRPVTEQRFHEAGFALPVSGEQRILFEPHRYLIQPERHRIDHEAIWQRSVESNFDGAPCCRLAVEDHLLHAVLHMAYHVFTAPQRMVRDIEVLLSRGGADLGTVIARAREWQCARATWLALRLVHQHNPALAPVAPGADRFAACIAPSLPIQNILQLLVPGPQGLRFQGLGLRGAQALLLPLLLDTPAQLLRFGGHYAWLRLKDAMAYARQRGALL